MKKVTLVFPSSNTSDYIHLHTASDTHHSHHLFITLHPLLIGNFDSFLSIPNPSFPSNNCTSFRFVILLLPLWHLKANHWHGLARGNTAAPLWRLDSCDCACSKMLGSIFNCMSVYFLTDHQCLYMSVIMGYLLSLGMWMMWNVLCGMLLSETRNILNGESFD